MHMTEASTSFTPAKFGIICRAALSLLFFHGLGLARDLDGKYANSPLKQWFDNLASRRGPCCSVADGQTVEDVDWDTKMENIGCDFTANGSRYRPTRW
jgi:hypothetical protein